MRYYKQTENGYITAIATGHGGTGITEAEYHAILAAIQSRPAAAGKGYRLKTDLTWEAYDLPEPGDEDELTDAEALNMILGVTA